MEAGAPPGAVTDPFESCHMGETAENVAGEFQVTRADQDELAAESHGFGPAPA